MSPDVLSFLETLPGLKEFTPRQLTLLARRMGARSLKKGEALFREGERGEQMFFVRQGTVLISKAVVGETEKVLARMHPGDFFGEMSLFGCLRRSATARAETDVRVLGLDRESLEHLMQLAPRAGLAFFTAMVQECSRRLATTDDLVAEVTRWGLEATGLAETES